MSWRFCGISKGYDRSKSRLWSSKFLNSIAALEAPARSGQSGSMERHRETVTRFLFYQKKKPFSCPRKRRGQERLTIPTDLVVASCFVTDDGGMLPTGYGLRVTQRRKPTPSNDADRSREARRETLCTRRPNLIRGEKLRTFRLKADILA